MKNKTPDDLDNAVAKKLNMYVCMYACVKMPERVGAGGAWYAIQPLHWCVYFKYVI